MTGGDEKVIYFWDCVSGIKKDSTYGKAFAGLLLEGTSARTGWNLETQHQIASCDI